MNKTVNKENLRNALIKYYNEIGKGIIANRLTNFVFIELKSKSYSFLPCDTDTLITKVKEDCYKVEGSFAKDYLK